MCHDTHRLISNEAKFTQALRDRVGGAARLDRPHLRGLVAAQLRQAHRGDGSGAHGALEISMQTVVAAKMRRKLIQRKGNSG